MSSFPILSTAQFSRVAKVFEEILSDRLDGEGLRRRIEARAGDDPAVARALQEMVVAHHAEEAGDDAAGGLHASALEAVQAETHAAGEMLAQKIPERIGPYRVLRFVASGGMSTVYEAEQDEPRRRVAIKVIRLELLTKKSIRRFEAEGHMLARLRHPGIARVLAMGRMDTPAGALPYLVLEYVDGVPVSQYVRDHGLDVRGKIELLRTIADAVQYAHDNGVLHRDLKPANILVDGMGRPHVLDFGIGQTFDDASDQASRTASGLFLGTLAYMSPEQAVRTETPLDVRVDVYGLGAVGYELLAGRPPQDVRDVPLHVAIQRVAQRTPPTLSSLDGELAGDVSAIFGKALATDPGRRYVSVRAFSEDLRRHLEHEAVQARPPSRIYQFQRLVRRHRTTAALLGLLLIALVGGLALSWSQRAAALAAEAQAKHLAKEAGLTSWAARVGAAWAAIEGQRPLEAAQAVASIAEQASEPGIELDLLRAHAEGATSLRPIAGLPPGGFVGVSPGADLGIVGDPSGGYLFVDLQAATCRPLLDDPRVDLDGTVSWSPRHPAWVVSSTKSRIVVVDTERRVVRRTIDLEAPTVALDPPTQDLILWTSASGRRLVDLAAGHLVHDASIQRRIDEAAGVHLVGGRLLVFQDAQHVRRTLDLTSGAERALGLGHFGLLGGKLSPDGRYLILSSRRPVVHDLETGEAWRIDVRARYGISDFAFADDGPLVGILGWAGSIQVWDLEKRALVHHAWDGRLSRLWRGEGHSSKICARSLRFLPGGRVRVVFLDRVVEWDQDLPPSRLAHGVGRSPRPYVYDLDWHPRGRWLASVAWDERAVIWDTFTGTEVGDFDLRAPIDAHPSMEGRRHAAIAPALVTWSPDGARLLVQLEDRWCLVWDAWTGALQYCEPLEARVLALGDDDVLTVVSSDGGAEQILLGEATSWTPDPTTSSPSMPFPPRLADARAETWPTPSWGFTQAGGRVARVRAAPLLGDGFSLSFQVQDVGDPSSAWVGACTTEPLCVELVDGGRRLLVGARDGTVQLFDVDTRRRLLTLQGFKDYVMALALSPDHATLAAGAGNGWIRLWPTVSTAERVRRLGFAREQIRRVEALVDRAWKAGATAAARRDALLADPELEEIDRFAALARLRMRLR